MGEENEGRGMNIERYNERERVFFGGDVRGVCKSLTRKLVK